MSSYCGVCDKIADFEIKNFEETYEIKGEKITFNTEVAFCSSCGNKVSNLELDNKTINTAYLIYRRNHNLLTPTEITNIRQKYSLSQRSLARLLEWGEITTHRYEQGSIQDAAHNEVLVLLKDTRNMREIFERNGHLLNPSAKKRLAEKLDKLLSSEDTSKFKKVTLIDCLANSQVIDEYSGFSRFSSDKMSNMILYIAEKTGGIFTTKLNKLLWYDDFLGFKEYSKSISGSRYAHLPLGPVPDDYKWIIAAVMDEGWIIEDEMNFPNGSGGSLYKSMAKPDLSLFNVEELNVMDYVIDFFEDYNCEEIKEYSHKERGYKETILAQPISYKFAADLSLRLSR